MHNVIEIMGSSGGSDNRAISPFKEELTMHKVLLLGSVLAAAFASIAHAQEIDWQKVDAAFGRKPAVSGDVHRYGFPRTDLSVTLDGVADQALSYRFTWTSLTPMHGQAVW